MVDQNSGDVSQAIRVLTGCRASGRGYAAGEICRVPDDIGADDAALLVRLGRAEQIEQLVPVEQTAEKRRGRK